MTELRLELANAPQRPSSDLTSAPWAANIAFHEYGWGRVALAVALVLRPKT